ncbi:hypothetical protein MD484_g8794, partial [Candolleomyces efflorescens]
MAHNSSSPRNHIRVTRLIPDNPPSPSSTRPAPRSPVLPRSQSVFVETAEYVHVNMRPTRTMSSSSSSQQDHYHIALPHPALNEVLEELRALKAQVSELSREQSRMAQANENLVVAVEALKDQVAHLTVGGPSRSPSPEVEIVVKEPPPFRLHADKFYVVAIGRCPGIYSHYGWVRHLVDELPEFLWKGFKSYQEAFEFWNDCLSIGNVKFVGRTQVSLAMSKRRADSTGESSSTRKKAAPSSDVPSSGSSSGLKATSSGDAATSRKKHVQLLAVAPSTSSGAKSTIAQVVTFKKNTKRKSKPSLRSQHISVHAPETPVDQIDGSSPINAQFELGIDGVETEPFESATELPGEPKPKESNRTSRNKEAIAASTVSTASHYAACHVQGTDIRVYLFIVFVLNLTIFIAVFVSGVICIHSSEQVELTIQKVLTQQDQSWREATVLAFLYTMFLAVDANFKLKGKDRKLDDIELGSGWGAFVEENQYQEFLAQTRLTPVILNTTRLFERQFDARLDTQSQVQDLSFARDIASSDRMELETCNAVKRKRFLKNLKEATVMKKAQEENFASFDNKFRSDVRERWEEMIKAWEADKSAPNPYEETPVATTLQEVRLQLATEEEQSLSLGEIQHEKVSMLSFLVTGLELEEEQRILKGLVRESPQVKLPTFKQQADLKEKQGALLRRIVIWRNVQRSYAPAAFGLAQAHEAQLLDKNESLPAQEVPLFMPSSLPVSLRGAVNRIVMAEARLREAQAGDALAEICRVRRVLAGLTTFKKYNLAGEGNKANTRVRAVYSRLQEKISRAAERYRQARTILLDLDPNGAWNAKLLELKNEDIRGPGKEENESHKRHMVSWIWMVNPHGGRTDGRAEKNGDKVGPAGEDEIHDSLRVDWARSRARKRRWEEEVLLIQEEMRRVVAYMSWKADWWISQASRRQGSVSFDISSGLSSYAHRQAAYCNRLGASCLGYWIKGLTDLGLDTTWSEGYEFGEASTGGDGELAEFGSDGDEEDEAEAEVLEATFHLDTDLYLME